jgi:hypothetical protein
MFGIPSPEEEDSLCFPDTVHGVPVLHVRSKDERLGGEEDASKAKHV